MRRAITLLITCLLANLAIAQLADFTTYVGHTFSKPEVHGFMYFIQPNAAPPGYNFSYYRAASGDVDNNMILAKQWTDEQLGMQHYRYNQVYKDIPVEGAGCTEHYKNGALIFTNAKHAVNLNLEVRPGLTKEKARNILIAAFPDEDILAWEDESWENELQQETGNPSATYLPEGELILALDNYNDLDFNISGLRYRLAYKFKVLGISPSFQTTYFVDANSGEIFKELSDVHEDGLATVHNRALPETIDTKERGFPYNDFILETDGQNRTIHTKYHSALPWIYRQEINDNDDTWVGYNENATTAYWYVMRAWDYYEDVWGREGMDDDGGTNVRISVEEPGSFNAFYANSLLGDNLRFRLAEGVSTGDFLDIVAHEYTHGVVNYTAFLTYANEPGALNESFCDIFGLLVERYVWSPSSTTMDWSFGPVGHRRMLNDPNSDGTHSAISGGVCVLFVGQPDTYEGVLWDDGSTGCDNGGVHGNSGVQNFWFYLLCNGGNGTNDILDGYNVEGIGIDKSAQITYWNLTNVLADVSQFDDARQGAITSAELLFGECSNESHQTANAWYAVGVGDESDCVNVLSNEESYNNFMMYPNPSNGQIFVNWIKSDNFDLNIYATDGKLIYSEQNISNNVTINLVNVANGVYILEASNGVNRFVEKLIIK